jgi:hypothetical protein
MCATVENSVIVFNIWGAHGRGKNNQERGALPSGLSLRVEDRYRVAVNVPYLEG